MMNVNLEMLENLKYDEVEICQEVNQLKIGSESKINFYKIEGLKFSCDEIKQKIKENIDILSKIESNQMCIPLTIAKIYFERASEPVEFCEKHPEIPFNNVILAIWKISIYKFFQVFFFAVFHKFEIVLAVDPPREKLINTFFKNILNVNLVMKKFGDSTVNPDLNQFPKISIIFKSSDINAAVQQITESANDPFNFGASINSIYVQESCYNDLCEKLQLQLKPYPTDISRDQYFLNEYKKSVDILKQLQPKLIQSMRTDASLIVPIICCDFNSNHLQDNPNLFCPIITLQSFRTVKECISLITENSEKNTFEYLSPQATIWSYNFAVAYEIVYKLNLPYFELNCYNISFNPFYKIILDDNGIVNTNTHHYQQFNQKNGDKTIIKKMIASFGVTYAN